MFLTSKVLTIVFKITECYTYGDLVVILSSIGNIVSKDRNENKIITMRLCQSVSASLLHNQSYLFTCSAFVYIIVLAACEAYSLLLQSYFVSVAVSLSTRSGRHILI